MISRELKWTDDPLIPRLYINVTGDIVTFYCDIDGPDGMAYTQHLKAYQVDNATDSVIEALAADYLVYVNEKES